MFNVFFEMTRRFRSNFFPGEMFLLIVRVLFAVVVPLSGWLSGCRRRRRHRRRRLRHLPLKQQQPGTNLNSVFSVSSHRRRRVVVAVASQVAKKQKTKKNSRRRKGGVSSESPPAMCIQRTPPQHGDRMEKVW